MAGASSKRIRPLRVLFAFIWGVVAVAAIVVAYAEPGNVASIPTVADAERPYVLGYGVIAMLASFLLAATASRPRRKERSASPVRTLSPAAIADTYGPISALRADGWYVMDGLRLPKASIDHVAVGPAGVLAIQVMHTDKGDDRGADAAMRARIGAEQLRNLFAGKEIGVDAVPAVLAWGPGIVEAPGGVFVHDSVAVLIGSQADEWRTDLNRHQLLDARQVAHVQHLVGELAEGRAATVLVRPERAAAVA